MLKKFQYQYQSLYLLSKKFNKNLNSNFLIFSSIPYQKLIQGHFSNNQLIINETPITIVDDVVCLQLSGGKLAGLCKSVGFNEKMEPRDEMVYWTMDLKGDEERKVPNREFAFELVDRMLQRSFDVSFFIKNIVNLIILFFLIKVPIILILK